MRRGSILVFDGSVEHGGGTNRTGARRVRIAMNYCAVGIYRNLIGHIDTCSRPLRAR